MQIPERVTWVDRDTVFSIRVGFVGRQRFPEMKSLEEWNQLWKQRDTGSRDKVIEFPFMLGGNAELITLSATNFVPASAGETVTNVGARVAPDEGFAAYQNWRSSAGYARWEERVTGVLAKK
jgi:hypothetical protein